MRSSYGAVSNKFLVFGLPLALALGAGAACTEKLPTPFAPPQQAARLETRPANATCLAPPLALGRVKLEPTFKGFTGPLAMVDRPDRGLVYVAEVAGRIKAVERATGKITTALDIVNRVSKDHEGMFGFAVHPTQPYVYLSVERDLDPATSGSNKNRGEIVRFTSSDGGKTYDPATEKLILRIDRPALLHPPGTLQFGKDGFLYIAVGEIGKPYSTNELYGSILRIDVDGGDPYASPPDNPFAKGGGRPEVWAGGFRNPWKFTFDRETNDIWEGDVGEGSFEEINKVERGKNYGWRTLEGETCTDGSTTCDRTGLTPPVHVYPHSDGRSVTGGYVYRGKAMPDLVGKYIFADFVVGHVRMLEGSGPTSKVVFLNSGGLKPQISSFGEDATDGELYILGFDTGILYKLVPGDGPGGGPVFPDRLSETGCVDPAHPDQPASGLVPYGVNVELWSDGATKRRFVAIPDGTTIKVGADGDFDLPERGVVMKEFAIDGKRIETRLLRRHAGGAWTGATYEWNDDQTDAVLLEHAKSKVLSNGQTWTFPSQIECFSCHTPSAGTTLGLETLQLNGDFEYGPGQKVNQLSLLSAIAFLDKAVDPAATPALPALSGAAPLEDRARAYLHANCSMCHREGGTTTSGIDLRFGLPLSAIRSCAPAFAPVEAMVITPGDPQHSAIYLRMAARPGGFQMPPLATLKVDTVALSVMESWIRARTTCD